MCRLALFNKKGADMIEEKYGLEKFFNYLEKANGGHGNGFALYKNNELVHLQKGLELTNVEITAIIKSTDFDYGLYHTRIVSVGQKTDANCHPFKCANVVLAMNGTETGYKDLANLLGTTDTEAVLKSIVALKLPLTQSLSKLSGTYVGFVGGKPFATSTSEGYKNFEIAFNDDGAIVLASQLPTDAFEVYEPKKLPFVWREKYAIKDMVKKMVRQSTNPRSYGADIGWRGGRGWNNVSNVGTRTAHVPQRTVNGKYLIKDDYVEDDVEDMLNQLEREGYADKVIVRDCNGKVVDTIKKS